MILLVTFVSLKSKIVRLIICQNWSLNGSDKWKIFATNTEPMDERVDGHTDVLPMETSLLRTQGHIKEERRGKEKLKKREKLQE